MARALVMAAAVVLFQQVMQAACPKFLHALPWRAIGLAVGLSVQWFKEDVDTPKEGQKYHNSL